MSVRKPLQEWTGCPSRFPWCAGSGFWLRVPGVLAFQATPLQVRLAAQSQSVTIIITLSFLNSNEFPMHPGYFGSPPSWALQGRV